MAISLGLGGTDTDDALTPSGFKAGIYSLLLATFAINIVSLALPIMTLQVYNRILPNPDTGTLPVLIVGVCVAIFLEAILRLSRAYVIGRTGATYEHLMACQTMFKILNADLSKMGTFGIGERLQRINSISKLKDFYNGYALTVLLELAFVPLFLGLIAYIAGYLVLVPSTILIAFALVSLWKGRTLQTTLQDRATADNKRFNFLIESLEGVHTLKSFALEKFFERRYEALEEDSTFANYKVIQETASTFNIGAVFSHLMVACVISAGVWFVLHGHLTTGGLIATLLLSGRIMQPIQKALALWTRYQDYLLARKHVEELLSIPQQAFFPRDEEKEIAPAGNICLSHVSFQYNQYSGTVLKDINLELKSGETVYISGAHGSGKTALLNLIAGIYPPTSGEIYIDGENINTYTPEKLVRHVGFIRATPIIFRGTIRENITCFGQIPETQARDIAKLLNVDSDVAKLQGGFDTFLNGNNTDVIPPGLKQRLAMVRVLAAKPKLVLFDNADHTLDKKGYTLIYSLLARLKGKASMILVTDDLNLSGLADRHYRLVNGELKEYGTIYGKGNISPYKELRL